MYEFENGLIKDIHISRYVASWIKAGGKINYSFKEWLRKLVINEEKLNESEIERIYQYGRCGKLELEISAKEFLQQVEQ